MRRRQSGDVFDCDIVSQTESQTTLRITGNNAYELFKNEAGGHRWQRVPPTEKGGRVHSSTVTIAVFEEVADTAIEFRHEDLEIKTSVGSGPGGQKRNKTETAVDITHIPTGLTVHCENEVSQKRNKQFALRELRARIEAAEKQRRKAAVASDRKHQVGTGQRSDKVRTVQTQNDKVTNHLNNRKCSLKSYLKGDIWKVQ